MLIISVPLAFWASWTLKSISFQGILHILREVGAERRVFIQNLLTLQKSVSQPI